MLVEQEVGHPSKGVLTGCARHQLSLAYQESWQAAEQTGDIEEVGRGGSTESFLAACNVA